MASTFGGLEIGKKALQVQKRALDVTGHNVANANTEGYSRQKVNLGATTPLDNYGTGAGQIGTGVEVTTIERIRDQFISQQMRKELSSQGKWKVTEDALRKMEMIFNEPSERGLQNVMNEFWSSLQDLSNDPESKAARATVRQRALMITDTFHHLDKQLTDYQLDLNDQIKSKVEEVNSYGQRIADLNEQIVRAEGMNQNANDLRDKRDLLIQELSQITNIQVKENDLSSVRVSISGRELVSHDQITKLELTDQNSDDLYEIRWSNSNQDFTDKFNNGEIKGLIDARDNEIANYRKQLDTLAKNLVEQFNKQHEKGYGLDDTKMTEMQSAMQDDNTTALGYDGNFDIIVNGTSQGVVDVDAADNLEDIKSKINAVSAGLASTVDQDGDGTKDTLKIADGNGVNLINKSDPDAGEVNLIKELGITGTGAGNKFFAGTTAQNIDLDAAIKPESTGLNKIAAAVKAADNGEGLNSYAGDAANALDLAQLGTTEITEPSSALDGTSFGDYYNSNIAQLGIDSQRATRMTGNQDEIVKQLTQQQESVSGVSLDEEMSQMVKFQHAYTAAAKVTSTMDEMLGVLVNNLKR